MQWIFLVPLKQMTKEAASGEDSDSSPLSPLSSVSEEREISTVPKLPPEMMPLFWLSAFHKAILYASLNALWSAFGFNCFVASNTGVLSSLVRDKVPEFTLEGVFDFDCALSDRGVAGLNVPADKEGGKEGSFSS